KLPEDPWGNSYKYLSPSQKGDYEITCLGTDGEVGGEGVNADITNWNLDKD
ncbi:MAG: type II secretion system protein GspG, partial [Nitrospiraceae bacterium]